MNMRKQRLMGVALIVIAWFVLLLACNGGENPEDRDATAALLVAPLGLYMLYSDTYLLYDDEVMEEGLEELDPWAPSSAAEALPHPLYPYESPLYNQLYREESTAWQENESSRPRASSPGRT